MTRRAAIRLTGVAAVLTLALAVSLTACGGADPSSAPAAKSPSFAAASSHGLELTDGWVSAAGDMGDMPGMTMSSGSMSGMDMDGSGAGEATAYATLTDTGASADALVSVSTPAATSVTLHDAVTSSDGSAGTMVDTPAIAVPAGGHVTLAPGGYHVMLDGLTTALRTGTRITMTWTFRSGATLTTSFPVIDPADRPQTDQR